MPTEKNIKAVDDLATVFKESLLVFAAEYRGHDVEQMTGFRAALRASDASFRVARNTLARLAAEKADRKDLLEFIDGPIGFVTGTGDPAAIAKAFVKHIADNRLEIKAVGGVLESESLSAERIAALAKLPTRDVLLAQLLGGMNGPIRGLVTVMNGPVRGLAVVLQRHIENQPEAEAGVEVEATE